MNPPSLSIVVCSSGRPELVDACVRSLLEHSSWEPQDEIVLVLNGPGRHSSRRRVDAIAPRADGPPVRVVERPTPGLSAARNAGAEAATGDVLVYLDDDARPRGSWLPAWRQAFALDPALAAAGGPIDLVWPGAPPRWLDPRLTPYWSGLDHPDADPSTIPVADRAFGANLGVRASSMGSVGPFDEDLGRGATVPGGEETELLHRMHAAGLGVGWVPDARVDHLVEPSRTRLRWLIGRAREQGAIDRALGSPAAAPWQPVIRGWPTLLAALVRDPGRWRQHGAVDLARRARARGRVNPLR